MIIIDIRDDKKKFALSKDFKHLEDFVLWANIGTALKKGGIDQAIITTAELFDEKARNMVFTALAENEPIYVIGHGGFGCLGPDLDTAISASALGTSLAQGLLKNKSPISHPIFHLACDSALTDNSKKISLLGGTVEALDKAKLKGVVVTGFVGSGLFPSDCVCLPEPYDCLYYEDKAEFNKGKKKGKEEEFESLCVKSVSETDLSSSTKIKEHAIKVYNSTQLYFKQLAIVNRNLCAAFPLNLGVYCVVSDPNQKNKAHSFVIKQSNRALQNTHDYLTSKYFEVALNKSVSTRQYMVNAKDNALVKLEEAKVANKGAPVTLNYCLSEAMSLYSSLGFTVAPISPFTYESKVGPLELLLVESKAASKKEIIGGEGVHIDEDLLDKKGDNQIHTAVRHAKNAKDFYQWVKTHMDKIDTDDFFNDNFQGYNPIELAHETLKDFDAEVISTFIGEIDERKEKASKSAPQT